MSPRRLTLPPPHPLSSDLYLLSPLVLQRLEAVHSCHLRLNTPSSLPYFPCSAALSPLPSCVWQLPSVSESWKQRGADRRTDRERRRSPPGKGGGGGGGVPPMLFCSLTPSHQISISCARLIPLQPRICLFLSHEISSSTQSCSFPPCLVHPPFFPSLPRTLPALSTSLCFPHSLCFSFVHNPFFLTLLRQVPRGRRDALDS